MKNKLLTWLEENQRTLVWFAMLAFWLAFWSGVVYTVYCFLR
jgi:hypothetical protein